MVYRWTAVLALVWASSLAANPITYQGLLQQGDELVNGRPVTLQFDLFDVEIGGDSLAEPLIAVVTPVNGLFQVSLDFGATVFAGTPRFLQVTVNDSVLPTRQRITAAPQALFAETVAGSAIGQFQVDSEEVQLRIADTCTGARYVQGISEAGELSCSGDDSNHVSGAQSTIGGGRNNTASGLLSVIGGGEGNQALEELATIAGGAVNTASHFYATVGGGRDNHATAQNSTIGGGADNRNSGESATVSGGLQNTAEGVFAVVGGGTLNTSSAPASTVSGGVRNTATSVAGLSSIGGGFSNTISGARSVIAGGSNNTAAADDSTISGGRDHVALGPLSTVAGGDGNCAGGIASWAGGTYAKVRPEAAPADGACQGLSAGIAGGDSGTFVWADRDTQSEFISSGPGQFLVRASGGAVITYSDLSRPGRNNPMGNRLLVDGALAVTELAGGGGVNLPLCVNYDLAGEFYRLAACSDESDPLSSAAAIAQIQALSERNADLEQRLAALEALLFASHAPMAEARP